MKASQKLQQFFINAFVVGLGILGLGVLILLAVMLGAAIRFFVGL